MKQKDTKLFLAILILIGLVICLLVISVRRPSVAPDNGNLVKQIANLDRIVKSLPTPKDGKTPAEGIDYFVQNGAPGVNGISVTGDSGLNGIGVPGLSAYDLAIKNGFQGTLQQWLDSLKLKGDKGDPAPELDLDCQNGVIAKKYSDDVFWQPTNIKCEITNE